MIKPKMSLDDVGRRYEHYREILELWEWGVTHLTGKPYLCDDDRRKLMRLQGAVFLLRIQLDVLSGFDDSRIQMRQEIDSIPTDPSAISGGRGEALEKQ